MSSLRKSGLLLLFVFLYLLFRGIGDHGLFDPLEGANASVALNMVARQNFFVPMVGSLSWGEKTMGYWWLSAAAMEIFGWTEFSMRFWSAAAALGTAAAVWFATRRMRNERAANYAAIIAATGLTAFIVSQLAASCSLYVFLVTLALTGVVCAFQDRRFFLMLHVASALAFVVQGPAGLILPWLSLLLYAWLAEEERFFLDALTCLPGLAATLLMGTGYLLLLRFKNPHLLTLMLYNPPAPAFGTFSWSAAFALLGLCPWFGFYVETLTQSVPRRWDDIIQPEHRHAVLLSVWAGVFLLYGLFAGNGLLVAAAFPALAPLCGDYLAKAAEENNIKVFQRTMLYEILFMIPFLCVGLFLLYRHPENAVRNTGTSMMPWAFFCCLFLFVGWHYARTRQPKKLMLHTGVVSLICLLPLAGAFRLLGDGTSIREIGHFLREDLTPRDTVVQYAMNRPSLFFYTAHDSQPTLVSPHPWLPAQKILNASLLLSMWNGTNRVFMVIAQDSQITVPLSQEVHNLKAAQGLVVLSNRKDQAKIEVSSSPAVEAIPQRYP